MKDDIEVLVQWLATSPPYDYDLPEGMSDADFLTAWTRIGDAPAHYLSGLSPDQVDNFVQHASDSLQFIVWWSTPDGGTPVNQDLKSTAITASPGILAEASRITQGRCAGCFMFWEQISGVRRDVEGGHAIWHAIGDALRSQLSSADECVKQSAVHGMEHYAETDAEAW
jgi:hypothetical protein